MHIQTDITNLIDTSLGEYTVMGGPGSGHYRHAGRKGKRGGSAPRGIAKKVPPTDSSLPSNRIFATITGKDRDAVKSALAVLPQEHVDKVWSIQKGNTGTAAATCQKQAITLSNRPVWNESSVIHEVGHVVQNSEILKHYRPFIAFYQERAKVFGRSPRDFERQMQS